MANPPLDSAFHQANAAFGVLYPTPYYNPYYNHHVATAPVAYPPYSPYYSQYPPMPYAMHPPPRYYTGPYYVPHQAMTPVAYAPRPTNMPSTSRHRSSPAMPTVTQPPRQTRVAVTTNTKPASSSFNSTRKRNFVDLTEDNDDQDKDHQHMAKKRIVGSTNTKPAPKAPKDTAKKQATQSANAPAQASARKDTRPQTQPPKEKRLRQFRPKPTHDFDTLYSRAVSQRMFLMSRSRPAATQANDTLTTETLHLAGTTGNIYTIVIDKLPTCTCPHFMRNGKQCKHIIYALALVLKAPYHLQYQLAFLSSELAEIMANAPALPKDGEGGRQGSDKARTSSVEEEEDPVRKTIEGECPICCMDFEESKDTVTYCRAGCGNNVHASCMKQWARMKKASDEKVTCPFCRTEWVQDKSGDADIEEAKKTWEQKVKNQGRGRYVNVAEQLGISGQRDWSSYHQPWVRARSYLDYSYD